MTLAEAIKKVESERGSKVVSAGDCGDRWVFSFAEDEDKIGSAPMFAFKNNGQIEYFGVIDYINSLESGQIQFSPIEISNK